MPSIVVVSSLFPSAAAPNAGIFIRERMFRVARHTTLTVVSPQPWFPGQSLIRLFRQNYRLSGDRYEVVDGIEIFRPRFFALPAIGRRYDSIMMALGLFLLIKKLKAQGKCEILDAHFAFPDGAAVSMIGRLLRLPVFITLRGTEPGHLRRAGIKGRLLKGLKCAAKIICVSQSLKDLMISQGIDEDKLTVVGNGVDTEKFQALDKLHARHELGISESASVLITVGGLVERKGFHRVMDVMPTLREEFPNLVYLVVGGASAEGDWSEYLKELASDLGIADSVRFLGQLAPDQLSLPLSAADVFVLSSRNEGWANVILESMACGTPVIASDVGGNAEVVCAEEFGEIIPFDDRNALVSALRGALSKTWNREALIGYAKRNDWQYRVDKLLDQFTLVRPAVGQNLGKTT